MRSIRARSSIFVAVLVAAAGVAAVGSSCNSSNRQSASVTAQFGIFFGGQIQQRDAIALEPDSTRQTQGFRVRFDPALDHAVALDWELDVPTRRQGRRGPGNAPRTKRTGQVEIPAGRSQYEQLIAFDPTDVPGTWNLRVDVDGTTVLDRPFRVVSGLREPDDD